MKMGEAANLFSTRTAASYDNSARPIGTETLQKGPSVCGLVVSGLPLVCGSRLQPRPPALKAE